MSEFPFELLYAKAIGLPAMIRLLARKTGADTIFANA